MPLLTVDNLRTHFHTRDGIVRAVDGVSFAIDRGETLGIVGESGSGKSVSCYSLLGLVPMPPGRIEGGTASFDGVDLLSASTKVLRSIRGKRIAMIFQDPMTALNPYMTIGAQVAEPLIVHEGMSRRAARAKALAMLEAVGIQDAANRFNQFPHQFSGGMRQRVTIAMALVTEPDLLIADEPTTALDVTVQAEILALIRRLQERMGMAMILVTHDLGVVAGTCERVLVMYAGRVLEDAPVDALFARPRHPYTQALIDSLPAASGARERLRTIPGMPPDLTQDFTGCPFAPRCDHAAEICEAARPPLEFVGDEHRTACVREQKGELPARV